MLRYEMQIQILSLKAQSGRVEGKLEVIGCGALAAMPDMALAGREQRVVTGARRLMGRLRVGGEAVSLCRW